MCMSCRDCKNQDVARQPEAGGDAGSVHAAPSPATSASTAVEVVTSASQQEDGGWSGHALSVLGSGTVDGAKLREVHRARLAADTSAVTILQGGGALALGEKLCEAVVPKRPKGTPILIKPNLGGFEWFKDPAKNHGDDGVHGRTTDSEFVRGIVRCLKARGHEKERITIAEGFAHTHADWKKLIRVSGYEAMAREEGVALVAMDDDGVFDVEGETPGKPLRVTGMEKTGVPTLLMPKLLADHLERGLWISAPKIKAHRFGVVSMSIKGMQGTVMLSDAAPAFHQKWRTHKELAAALKLLTTDKEAGQAAYMDSLHTFAERMSDLLEVSAPDVVLAEGAPAMGGDGFAKRYPSAEDYAIGGTNPILVDRVGAAMLGLWDNADLAKSLGGHKTSPLIEAAAKRFAVDITSPKVEGNGKALLEKPRPVHFLSMNGFSLHSNKEEPEVAPRIGPSSSSSSSPSEDAAHPEVEAKRVDDGTIAVDGVADASWKKITPVTFRTDWSGAETGITTTVRLAWSTSAFYMLWELADAGLNSDATAPLDVDRAGLYNEDCVELFLGPDATERRRYFEVEVGPHGHFLDIAIDRSASPKKSDVAWSSKPKIATKIDKAKSLVTIEVELRAPEIVNALKAGAKLPIALYRMEGKSPRKYLAWSPTRTAKPDFHVPDAFGVVKLVE